MPRRLVGLFVSSSLVLSACAGGGSDGLRTDTSRPDESRPATTDAAEPWTSDSVPRTPDLSDLAISPDEGSGLRFQQHVEEQFIAALADHGVTLEPGEFRELDRGLAAETENRREEFDDAIAQLVASADGASGGSEVTDADEVTEDAAAMTGVGLDADATPGRFMSLAMVAPSPTARSAVGSVPPPKSQESTDATIKFMGIFTILLIKHDGPGDSGPNEIKLSDGWSMSREQRGSRVTVTLTLRSVAAMSAGPVRFGFEFSVSYNACPDEAGESDFETSIRYELSLDVPGAGVVSSELEVTAHGAAIVDDDAKFTDLAMDVDASQARRTTAADGTQSGASFIEGSWSMDKESSHSFTATRASSTATASDYLAMVERASDLASWFSALTMVNAQDGWKKGQCIELTVVMPDSVAPSSQTAADAKVEHRYEERVLELPINAEVTAGGDAIDPPEATGDPATFTYTAPPKTGEATLTFEVRSKRGADEKTVVVKIEAGVIDLTLTGTLSYSVPGEVRIGGTVTIGKVYLRQYDGDDAELAGKWVGEGDVEVDLTADVPGCGAATGTQTGGRVTIVGTPTEIDGRPALALFSEEMQGGSSTMSCGAAGAIVDGGAISIGAGLVNLGKVVIPLAPGTYPFDASGVAGGLVDYVIAGEALVEESADFPGT